FDSFLRHLFLYSVLFWSRVLARHDLPSFPTRRSSDPIAPAPPIGAAAAFRPFGVGSVARRARGHIVDQHLTQGYVGADHAEGRRSESTRLNSSHGSISYAVFCLKKKK